MTTQRSTRGRQIRRISPSNVATRGARACVNAARPLSADITDDAAAKASDGHTSGIAVHTDLRSVAHDRTMARLDAVACPPYAAGLEHVAGARAPLQWIDHDAAETASLSQKPP